MSILIRNGRVLNPATNTDKILDVLTNNGKILAIEEYIDASMHNVKNVIDATGCYVMPGLIDMHVHLREPGLTYKEDIEFGTLAAAKGGFTTIVAMANTSPPIDNGRKLLDVNNIIAERAIVNVIQVGSLTKNLDGWELSDTEGLARNGVIALSDDGKTVMDANLFRQGLREAKKFGMVVLAHCEDENLKANGIYNKGEASRYHGVPGISNSTEDVIVARDIIIAEEIDAKIHICHCSTKGSVDLIREAKNRGFKVTAEVCPHHFTLTENDIKENDSNYKMSPPLRTAEDRQALIRGLKDGVIDVIASDHAPHTEFEKGPNIETAPFGISGLETSVSLAYTHLVKPGILSPLDLVAKMSYHPAKILGINRGNLSVGKDADITIMDPNKHYVIDKFSFISKGKNTPFHGHHVQGKIIATIRSGEIVYEENNYFTI